MLNWQEIVDQGLDGLSEGELVGLLSVQTARPMENAAAREFLREQGLWFQAGPAAMAGVIAEVESSLSANAQAVKGQMYSALWAEGTRIRSDLAEFAPAVNLLVSELEALGAVSAEQVEAWYALGGGRPHVDLVEADVAQARQEYVDEVSQAAEQQAKAMADMNGRDLLSASFDVLVQAKDSQVQAIEDAFRVNENAFFNEKVWHADKLDASGKTATEIDAFYAALDAAQSADEFPQV